MKWKINPSFGSAFKKGRPSSAIKKQSNEIHSKYKKLNDGFDYYHRLCPSLSNLFLLKSISKEQFTAGCYYKKVKENALSYLNNMRSSSFARSTLKVHNHGINENIEKSIKEYKKIKEFFLKLDRSFEFIIDNYVDDDINHKILPYKLVVLKEGLSELYKFLN